MELIYLYLLFINVLGAALMLGDKQKAKKKAWRIPEAMLLTVAALGGSPGVLLGMLLFRHKTQRPRFFLGVPLFLGVHILLWLLLNTNLQ